MDEIWERAITTAVNGETNPESVKSLTLDGAVKCSPARFPPPWLFQKFTNLEHLSIANACLTSLQNFPSLPKLHRLVLSDNRIGGGLENLVKAGLKGLRDLDLSNNRIQFVCDLKPLGEMGVVSLDLYECPVTKVGGYRGKVFELVKSLKFLDKVDLMGVERVDSDDDDDDGVEVLDADEDEEVVEVHEIEDSDEDEENGDEDEESDEDEEEVELVSTGRLTSTEGEIDGHEHGEEEEDSESGEEEEVSSDEDGTFVDEDGTEFLVQSTRQYEEKDVGGSDLDADEEDDYSREEEEALNVEGQSQPSTSSQSKRKRDEDNSVEEEVDTDDDEGLENKHVKRKGNEDDSVEEDD